MSYIPDVRTDDAYNQNKLNHDDAGFVDGFDYATEEVVDNFFDNFIDDFGAETTTEPEDADDEAVNSFYDALTAQLPEYLKEQYTMCWKFGGRKDEERKCETFLDYLRYRLLEWLEMNRNELIVSMLDGYEEETDGDSEGKETERQTEKRD